MSTRLAIGAVGLLAGLAALGATVASRGPQLLTLGHYGAMRPFVNRVKRGEAAATAEAGRLLGELLPEGAVLVPVPSSKGGLGGAGALGRAILAARPDVSVVPALRGVARQSTRDRKRRGKRPLTHNEMWFLPSRHALPPGRPVYLLDNVVDTGATIRAAHRALDPMGARLLGVVALAHTGRHGSLARRGSRQWLHGAPESRCQAIERDGWINESRVLQELPTLADLIRARAEVMAEVAELERSGADDDTVQLTLEHGMLDAEEASLTPMEGFAYAAVDGAGREFLKDGPGNCIYEVALTPGALVLPDEDWLGDLFLGQIMDWGAARARPRSGTVNDPSYKGWRKRLSRLVPWRGQWTRQQIDLIDTLMEDYDEDTIAMRAAIGRDLIAHLMRRPSGRAWLEEGAREHAPSIAHEGPMRVVRRVELPDPAWMANLDPQTRAKIKAKLAGGTP